LKKCCYKKICCCLGRQCRFVFLPLFPPPLRKMKEQIYFSEGCFRAFLDELDRKKYECSTLCVKWLISVTTKHQTKKIICSLIFAKHHLSLPFSGNNPTKEIFCLFIFLKTLFVAPFLLVPLLMRTANMKGWQPSS